MMSRTSGVISRQSRNELCHLQICYVLVIQFLISQSPSRTTCCIQLNGWIWKDQLDNIFVSILACHHKCSSSVSCIHLKVPGSVFEFSRQKSAFLEVNVVVKTDFKELFFSSVSCQVITHHSRCKKVPIMKKRWQSYVLQGQKLSG